MGIGAFEFVGNVEGGDVVAGVADVIVTDGFTGNIALKLMEGVSQTMLGAMRDAASSSVRAKIGGALLRGALSGFREEIDPGGARGRLSARAAQPGGGSSRAVHANAASPRRSCGRTRERART